MASRRQPAGPAAGIAPAAPIRCRPALRRTVGPCWPIDQRRAPISRVRWVSGCLPAVTSAGSWIRPPRGVFRVDLPRPNPGNPRRRRPRRARRQVPGGGGVMRAAGIVLLVLGLLAVVCGAGYAVAYYLTQGFYGVND